MASYKIDVEAGGPQGADLLRVGFADPAQNDQIVRDAAQRLAELVETGALAGGELVLVNGPASLPVACVLAHAVGHLYAAVGVFDPKMAGYVVAIAHGGQYAVGDVIAA